VDHRVSLTAEEKRKKNRLCRESNPVRSARRYTTCVIKDVDKKQEVLERFYHYFPLIQHGPHRK
jgi:hypothetical protein